MPTIIPHGIGFTHIQVYTNSIGTAEVDVTSFHCGPIFTEWGQFTLVSVVKKCLFRVIPGNEFVVLSKTRMVFCYGNFSMHYGFYDELLGFTVPHYVPDEVRDLVDELRYCLRKADEKASASATFANPSNFGQWLTTFMPTMTKILCNGLMVVQLPMRLSNKFLWWQQAMMMMFVGEQRNVQERRKFLNGGARERHYLMITASSAQTAQSAMDLASMLMIAGAINPSASASALGTITTIQRSHRKLPIQRILHACA